MTLTSREGVEAYIALMEDADIRLMIREALEWEETGRLPQSSRIYVEVLNCRAAGVNIEGMIYHVYRSAALRFGRQR